MSVQVQGPVESSAVLAARPFNAGWAIRRAVLGLVILVVGIGSLAWLTHASIDPALESAVSDRR